MATAVRVATRALTREVSGRWSTTSGPRSGEYDYHFPELPRCSGGRQLDRSQIGITATRPRWSTTATGSCSIKSGDNPANAAMLVSAIERIQALSVDFLKP